MSDLDHFLNTVLPDIITQGGGSRPSPSNIPAHKQDPVGVEIRSPWQVRTLPDRLGWGLYCPSTEKSATGPATVAHWYGVHGHRAVSAYSAERFATSDGAKA